MDSFVHPESGNLIFFKPILGFVHLSALTLQFFLTGNPERQHFTSSSNSSEIIIFDLLKAVELEI